MILIHCDNNISLEILESRSKTGYLESLRCNILQKNTRNPIHTNLGKIILWSNKINIIFYSNKESRFNEITKNAMKYLLDYYFYNDEFNSITNSHIEFNANEKLGKFMNFYQKFGFKFYTHKDIKNKLYSFCEKNEFYKKFPELIKKNINYEVQSNKRSLMNDDISHTKRPRSNDESSCETITTSESSMPSVFSLSSQSSVSSKSKILRYKSSSENGVQKIDKPKSNLILALNGYNQSLENFSECKL